MGEEDLDKGFWGFVYLIVTHPDKYLNKKGKMVYEIGKHKGTYGSITKIARQLDIDIATASELCKELNDSGHILSEQLGTCKQLQFTGDTIDEGLKIAYSVIGRKDEYEKINR